MNFTIIAELLSLLNVAIDCCKKNNFATVPIQIILEIL